MIDDVRTHLEQLLSAGIIRKSHSPYSSNIVLVKKKDGRLRMCVDYRMLNQRTVKYSFALPRIDDVLDILSGSKYFTALDMKSGYHQIELEESHKDRTAFTVGTLGFFEFERLPFGLCNSPATYQRIMEDCMGDLNMKICMIYLDDLIIFADSIDEHIRRLEIVFNRLRECGLKLATKKCSFLQRKVKYVGHIVSAEGIETDPDKVRKVRDWPTPTNAEEVRQFVAFAGFYRKFIKDFSKTVKPLNEVMPPQNQKKSKKTTSKNGWSWGNQQEIAFQKLKELMTSAPILAYPNYNDPFELHIDASRDGLGAVLCQKQDGKERVISFASRSLSRTEKNYHTMKLEFLALKWAVCDKFNDYLYGHNFTVMTDNNPLTYALTTAKLDATGQRWISSLATFNFQLIYKQGRKNVDADAMSRNPLNRKEEKTEVIPCSSVQAICRADQETPLIHTVAAPTIDIVELTDAPGQPMAQVDMRDLRRAQREDPVIGYWISSVRDQMKPRRDKLPGDREHLAMLKSFNSLEIVRGVLYRKVQDNEKSWKQLVLPAVFIEKALVGLHNNIGHPGRDRTLSLLRERFYWPGMGHDTENWVKSCERCLKSKGPTNNRAPMVNITTTYPLELVCCDFLTLEQSKGGIGNILVITDHFTRFAMAIPTRNQTAKTTAEAMFNNFIIHYGIPTRLHSDQGANFESDLIKELCKLTGMKKSRTTVYHPMSNGMTERFNRTLINMLRSLHPEEKADWKSHVAPLVYAYNSTKHESTGHSPFELMFGRTPKLPVDISFGLDHQTGEENSSYSDYIKKLKEQLQQSFEIVNKEADRSREKQKANYDRKAKAADLVKGDRVLVKKLAFEGKHKIADRFEEEVYTIVDKPNKDIPVFKLKSDSNRERTLHRNHLLPVSTEFIESGRPTPAPRGRAVREKPSTESEKPVPKQRKIKKQEDDRQEPEPQQVLEDNEDKVEVLMTGKSSVPEYCGATNDESTDSEDAFVELSWRDKTVSEQDGCLQSTDTVNDEPDEDMAQARAETTEDGTVEQRDRPALGEVPLAAVDQPTAAPRRSTRPKRKPKWHEVYQVGQITRRSLEDRMQVVKAICNSDAFHQIPGEATAQVIEAVLFN